ncbi:MAG: N-acetylglucosamine kinase [Terriglobales bacterium]
MSLFLGIDGGGSKTVCAVADETNVLARATTGGCNVVRLGEETARANLQDAIRQACETASVRPQDIDAAVIGVAGAASVAAVAETVRRATADLGLREVEVVGDNVIAMEAAFAGLPGVVVMAGTGSIAFARNPRGETARAGGYGFAVSDEGSGHWIGRALIAAALRAHDQGSSHLLDAAIAHWAVDSRDALVRRSNQTPPPDFAQLFPFALQAATAGDTVAMSVLHDAGRELAGLASTVLSRLWEERKPVRVALGGGVFANAAAIRKTFYISLREKHPLVAVNFRPIEPVAGALWLARRAGVKVRG